MISEYVRAAIDSRTKELEAAIIRFRECGVEIERFSIIEHADCHNETILCIDGSPRFSWRMTCSAWPSPD